MDDTSPKVAHCRPGPTLNSENGPGHTDLVDAATYEGCVCVSKATDVCFVYFSLPYGAGELQATSEFGGGSPCLSPDADDSGGGAQTLRARQLCTCNSTARWET